MLLDKNELALDCFLALNEVILDGADEKFVNKFQNDILEFISIILHPIKANGLYKVTTEIKTYTPFIVKTAVKRIGSDGSEVTVFAEFYPHRIQLTNSLGKSHTEHVDYSTFLLHFRFFMDKSYSELNRSCKR